MNLQIINELNKANEKLTKDNQTLTTNKGLEEKDMSALDST